MSRAKRIEHSLQYLFYTQKVKMSNELREFK